MAVSESQLKKMLAKVTARPGAPRAPSPPRRPGSVAAGRPWCVGRAARCGGLWAEAAASVRGLGGGERGPARGLVRAARGARRGPGAERGPRAFLQPRRLAPGSRGLPFPTSLRTGGHAQSPACGFLPGCSPRGAAGEVVSAAGRSGGGRVVSGHLGTENGVCKGEYGAPKPKIFRYL